MVKSLVLAAGGTLLLGMGGCTDEATSVSTTSDLLSSHNHGHGKLPNGVPVLDSSGLLTTDSSAGSIDLDNEFFQNFGTNGRRCVSCHQPTAAWTITPEQEQFIFDLTDGGAIDDGFGLGAIFRTVDGSNSPTADTSTLAARRSAYSMLLTKGVIRIGLPVPATADFTLVGIDDPYGHSTAADVSMFRRPLPTTNINFLSTIMWDGRETFRAPAGSPSQGACAVAFTDAQGKQFCSIPFDLSDQSNGATLGHAQGLFPLAQNVRDDIVNFQEGLATAQVVDFHVGNLSAAGAKGGEDNAAAQAQAAYVGINDLFGDAHTGAAFNPVVFNLYDAWDNSNDSHRAQIARGQALFNTRTINITGVGGINDSPDFGNPPLVVGSCTVCHDTPNGGNHSVPAPLNIGLVGPDRRTADLPLYTFRNNATGATVQVTDPGRAMVTGKFADIGKFKGPVLRGLAARAPYFHNGSAASLDDAVDFYNTRFNMNLSAQEHADLVAFLKTL